VEIRDPKFRDVVGDSVSFEKLGTGFLFTEGPLWHAAERYLLFSDMPGDHLRRWSAADGVTTFRKPSNMSNGLCWDRQGRLLACEHATSRVTRTEADGTITVVASHYDGQELNSPNDIIVRSDGAIYFTDPTYGRAEYYGRPHALRCCLFAVCTVLSPAACDSCSWRTISAQPNGLCFSLDEKRLFVNDTDRQHIRVFDVNRTERSATAASGPKLAAKGQGRRTG
jgi:gluconolactonase